MIKTIKLKPFLGIVFILLFSFMICFSFNHIANTSKNNEFYKYTIILDAGHGGSDSGTIGKMTKVKEADLNLIITKKLKEYLKNFGFNVILTRNGKDSLGKDKISDMEKRKQIINKINPYMVVSIHANSYTNEFESGTQVFYKIGNKKSKALADSIQSEMKIQLPNARENSNHGDYFILECSNTVSCIVECGFLSNSNDEKLLNTKEYRDNLAYSIYSGIVKYIITNN